MTRQQFEQVRMSIESEQFHATSSDILTFGIQRAAFERQKLKRLIAATKGLPFITVKTKCATWQRQLQRASATEDRLTKLRAEIKAVRPTVMSALMGENLPYTRS